MLVSKSHITVKSDKNLQYYVDFIHSRHSSFSALLYFILNNTSSYGQKLTDFTFLKAVPYQLVALIRKSYITAP